MLMQSGCLWLHTWAYVCKERIALRSSFLSSVHMSLTTLKSLEKSVFFNCYLLKVVGKKNTETIFSFVKVYFLLTFKLLRNFMKIDLFACKSLLFLFWKYKTRRGILGWKEALKVLLDTLCWWNFQQSFLPTLEYHTFSWGPLTWSESLCMF